MNKQIYNKTVLDKFDWVDTKTNFSPLAAITGCNRFEFDQFNMNKYM